MAGNGLKGIEKEGLNESMKEAINEEEAGQLSRFPRHENNTFLEMAENVKDYISNFSPGLDSFVAESVNSFTDPIMTINQDYQIEYEEPKSDEGGKLIPPAAIRKNFLCPDGPIVLDSNNSLRPSQLPSINIQVDLNPKEARRILRKRIRDEVSSPESSDFIRNKLNAELEATAEAGRIIGVEFTNVDLLMMEKLIGKENNRFAPLHRSTSIC